MSSLVSIHGIYKLNLYIVYTYTLKMLIPLKIICSIGLEVYKDNIIIFQYSL